MSKGKLILKTFLWLLFIALFATAAYGVFFIWKMNRIGAKISTANITNSSFIDTIKNLASDKNIDLDGYKDGRINILLLGIAGTKKGGANLTDTIMVASIDTETNQVALLSIPRDLYVTIPGKNVSNKINTAYEFGLNQYPGDATKAIQPVASVVEDITSLKINYWVIVNFQGFENVIDTIGGINVMNEWDIYDPQYPGPEYSYETFELPKGLRHLDGATALKYARMRHNDPEGDFGRAKRQQQVLQTTKNKIFSTGTLLNVVALNDLLDALGDNVRTNISPDKFGDFLELAKKVDTNNINNMVIDAWNKDSLLIVSHVFFGDTRAFVLVPRTGDWSETRELAQNIFDINTLKNRREQISSENASVMIVNKSDDSNLISRIDDLLKSSFDYKNVNNMTVTDKTTTNDSYVYDLAGGSKPFTLDELAKKLPAQISSKPPAEYEKLIEKNRPEILVVIGKDLVDKYKMEKDSFEEYNNSNN